MSERRRGTRRDPVPFPRGGANALAWLDEGGTSASGPSWEEFSPGTGLPPPSHALFDALVAGGWAQRIGAHAYRFRITPAGRRKRQELWLAGRDRAFPPPAGQARGTRRAAHPAKPSPAARRNARRDPASLIMGGLAGAALGAIGTSTYVGLRRSKEGPFVLPAYHEPGMRVPRGGTSCANCRYVFYPDGKPHCAEPHFVAWNKGTRIPVDDAREYCSDWWQPTREAARQMELQARRQHVPRTRSAGAGRRDTR